MRKRATVKDRVTELARDVLGPQMKRLGFRRTGRTFWRDGPKVCQILRLDMGRWGTPTAGDFDVMLGVFWHGIEKALANPSAGRMPAPYYLCTFHVDLGWVTPARIGRSWDVNLSTDLRELGEGLWADLNAYGLPWLDYRSRLQHALEWKKYMRPEGGGISTTHESLQGEAKVLFMLMLGKFAAARREVKSWHESHAPSAKLAAYAEKETKRLVRALKRAHGLSSVRMACLPKGA